MVRANRMCDLHLFGSLLYTQYQMLPGTLGATARALGQGRHESCSPPDVSVSLAIAFFCLNQFAMCFYHPQLK